MKLTKNRSSRHKTTVHVSFHLLTVCSIVALRDSYQSRMQILTRMKALISYE